MPQPFPVLPATLVLLTTLVLPGCGGSDERPVDGSGVIRSESRPVGKFSAIELTGTAKLAIKRTGSESLSVAGDDNLLALFTSEVRDDTLRLSVPEEKRPSQIPVYTISLSDLRKIDIKGVATIEATKLDGASLSISALGTAKGQLAGRADELAIDIKGGAALDATELKAKRGKVSLAGAGVLTVNASDELEARVSGVGVIWYIGDPRLKADASGVATVKKKPAAANP